MDVRIRQGIRQRFRVAAPAPLGELRVQILRGAERVLDTSHRAIIERPIAVEWEHWLAPGEYTVNATGDGLSVRATFTVREGDEIVIIELR